MCSNKQKNYLYNLKKHLYCEQDYNVLDKILLKYIYFFKFNIDLDNLYCTIHCMYTFLAMNIIILFYAIKVGFDMYQHIRVVISKSLIKKYEDMAKS